MKLGYKGHLNTRNKFPKSFFFKIQRFLGPDGCATMKPMEQESGLSSKTAGGGLQLGGGAVFLLLLPALEPVEHTIKGTLP
jgi:hypothetical protein